MRYLFLISAAFCLSGCGAISRNSLTGYIYVHTRIPYTQNLDNTPVADHGGEGKIIEVKEPFSGYGVTAKFNSNAVGDIARLHGIETVYWADLEYFNLLGIWKERKLHIYGK